MKAGIVGPLPMRRRKRRSGLVTAAIDARSIFTLNCLRCISKYGYPFIPLQHVIRAF